MRDRRPLPLTPVRVGDRLTVAQEWRIEATIGKLLPVRPRGLAGGLQKENAFHHTELLPAALF